MKKPIVDLLFERALKAIESNSSTEAWSKALGLELYSNQIEIIDTMCSDDVNNLTILAARSAGKTYAVSVGCYKMCSNNPGYEVLIFGPKQALATRVIDQIMQICKAHKDTIGKDIDWRHCNSSFIQFVNGSRVRALSGGEGTQVEGHHCLTAGNMIKLEDGTEIPIQDVKVGTKVLTFNSENKLVSGEVVATNVRLPEDELYEVSYLLNNKIKTVKCTGSHRFFTKNRGIVEAKDLTETDILIGVV